MRVLSKCQGVRKPPQLASSHAPLSRAAPRPPEILDHPLSHSPTPVQVTLLVPGATA